jgi:hypothetical protein
MPIFGFIIGITTLTDVMRVSYNYFKYFWKVSERI